MNPNARELHKRVVGPVTTETKKPTLTVVREKAAPPTAADRSASSIQSDLDNLASCAASADHYWNGGGEGSDADEAMSALDDLIATAKSLKSDMASHQDKHGSADADDENDTPSQIDPADVSDAASRSANDGALETKAGSGQPDTDAFEGAVKDGIAQIADAIDTVSSMGYQDTVEELDSALDALKAAADGAFSDMANLEQEEE